ncbi:uncharacterized protein I206_107285 [Kwoniella pini CBS 10737]|uniref:Uncharacterized protein n=1 Tax=Kwoniella pini CBS 10737 TaxID=1296096 RepID=A0A1B9HYN0_9TREE|nr:uncharacterized protein I206_05170 [Kwoniella pini CBS 10737]OCF48393.1 hypothetical protein I206_05170 [Kwoniella pini CBS 10737]
MGNKSSTLSKNNTHSDTKPDQAPKNIKKIKQNETSHELLPPTYTTNVFPELHSERLRRELIAIDAMRAEIRAKKQVEDGLPAYTEKK